MQRLLPFVGVILALFAAGCIAVVAWEITKEALGEREIDDE